MPPLDPDHCYAAASSRDARFDGVFVIAVRTTGIYCRPSCPAVTPKRTNVEFHPTAAAAQQRGFRACKRCRPDASPGSPEWNVRQDLVGRAMRLIADGVVERAGVPGLAARLGYSERHLNRLLTSEVGAGPLALARAQRAQTARVLIETTDMAFADVAFAAGFGSVRQFNDTMREVFDTAPRDLRRTAHRASSRRGRPTGENALGLDGGHRATTVTLRLPVRLPFPALDTLDFVGRRSIVGVESYETYETPATSGTCATSESRRQADEIDRAPACRRRYRRALRLPHGSAVLSIELDGAGVESDLAGAVGHVVVTVELADVTDLATAVQRIRRMLDLDADPAAVDAHLGSTVLRDAVRRRPGRRSPVGVDPFETLVRAIIGQQISVAGARTVAGHLVERVAGDRVENDGVWSACHDVRLVPFPDASSVAEAPDDAFSMPAARRDTIRRVAEAVAGGVVPLHVGADPAEARERLLALKGIGPWTADYVLMRGLAHPDVLLSGDLGVRHGACALGLGDLAEFAGEWAPWRSYATHHLWAAVDPPPTTDQNGETS
ncbi:MAG: Ada metal-binding domain-containing protein [Actinomycetota bacterium]